MVEKESGMRKEKVPKLILRLSLPTMLAMLVNSAYSIADAFFVARLGTEATGAVGISFSLVSLLQAVGFTFGSGGGSLVSKALGRKEKKTAKEISALSFWVSLLLGACITLFGLIFLNPLIRFLGATEGIFPYARSYAFFLLLASPVLCSGFTLSYLLRAKGSVLLSMAGLGTGYLLNILLDPFFIGTLKLGIAGASIATLVGQSVGFLILFFGTLHFRDVLSLSPLLAFRTLKKLKNVFITGLPSLFRQGFAAVGSILLTRTAARFGDAAVAGISITSRIFLLIFGFCLGIGQGMMPAAGFFEGEKNRKKVLEIYRFSLLFSTAVLAFLSLLSGIFAPFWISLFRPDEEVVSIGAKALRFQSAVACLHGTITCTDMLLQAVGKPLPAAILAVARQGFFLIPFVLLLPRFFQLSGLIITQAAADLATFLFTIPFAVMIFRKNERAIKSYEL